MNEEFEIEWKKNADLTRVLNALKNDFPYFDDQIMCLLNSLKSVES